MQLGTPLAPPGGGLPASRCWGPLRIGHSHPMARKSQATLRVSFTVTGFGGGVLPAEASVPAVGSATPGGSPAAGRQRPPHGAAAPGAGRGAGGRHRPPLQQRPAVPDHAPGKTPDTMNPSFTNLVPLPRCEAPPHPEQAARVTAPVCRCLCEWQHAPHCQSVHPRHWVPQTRHLRHCCT